MVAKMTFRDDVKAETRSNGVQCKTCRTLASLDPKEAAEVADVIADPDITAEAISRAMKRRGWGVSGNGIRQHRRNCIAKK